MGNKKIFDRTCPKAAEAMCLSPPLISFDLCSTFQSSAGMTIILIAIGHKNYANPGRFTCLQLGVSKLVCVCVYRANLNLTDLIAYWWANSFNFQEQFILTVILNFCLMGKSQGRKYIPFEGQGKSVLSYKPIRCSHPLFYAASVTRFVKDLVHFSIHSFFSAWQKFF